MGDMSEAETAGMRVLHVVEALGGGVMTTLADYVLATPQIRHVVLGHIRPGYDTGEDLAGLGATFEPCPTRMDAAIRAVSSNYRRHRPDVVHAHSSYAGVWVRLARIPADRIVYTPHCYAFERTDLPTTARMALRLLERLLTARTAAVVAVSPREAELARSMNRKVPAYEVPNVSRVEEFDPTDEPFPTDDPLHDHEPLRDNVAPDAITEREALIVAGVGRLSEQKDPAFFGEVAQQTRTRDPRIRFVWLGGSNDPADETALRLRGVEVSGWTTRTEILRRLRESDVYLHTAAWEGAPLTVLEAAQVGLPVVGRRVPALESLGIEDLRSTPAEVSDVLLQLRDLDQRRAVRERSRQLLLRHSPSVQRERLLAAYRDVRRGGQTRRKGQRIEVDASDEPSRPLHVLIVNPSGVLGGAERWLLQLLDATDRLRVEVVSLAEGPLNDALRNRGAAVTVIETGRELHEVARSSQAIAAHLRRVRPEVVLANGLKAAVAVAPAAWATGVPSAWAIHDFSRRRLAPALSRAFDLVVANSSAVAATTRRDDVPLVPPPLPAEPFSHDDAVAELRRLGVPWPAETESGLQVRRLACVGRLVPYKGVDMAIEAIAGTDEWELIVLGSVDPAEPDELERLRTLAAAHGVRDRVHIVGEVPEAGRLLSAVDAVAILTRPEGPFGREGYSLVALEALRAGRPLIGARSSPVVAELAGRTGAVVSPDDVSAVVDALHHLGSLSRVGPSEVSPSASTASPSVGSAEVPRAGSAHAPAGDVLAGHPSAPELADALVSHLARVALRPGAGISTVAPISVVTTMRDEESVVDSLVPAVLAQLRPDDEYVVVDDGSSDDTPTELRRWSAQDPRLRIVTIPPSGRSQGRNAGFAAARHPLVAVTDAGCRPRDGWLDALRGAFAEPDAPELVVGVYHVVARTPFEQAAAVANYPDVEEARRRTPLTRLYTRLLGRAFDPTALDGRSFAVARDAWRAVGGFPEHLRTAEDYAFGRAVLETGRRSVLAVEAAVDWFPRPDLTSTARMYFGYGRGDGEQRAPRPVARNLVRVVSAGAALVLSGGRRGGRRAVAVGAATALSLPMVRAYRYGHPLSTWVRIPLVIAVKDTAKAAGCLAGLLRPRGSEDRPGDGKDRSPDTRSKRRQTTVNFAR